MPSLSSSPRIRSVPQCGFSRIGPAGCRRAKSLRSSSRGASIGDPAPMIELLELVLATLAGVLRRRQRLLIENLLLRLQLQVALRSRHRPRLRARDTWHLLELCAWRRRPTSAPPSRPPSGSTGVSWPAWRSASRRPAVASAGTRRRRPDVADRLRERRARLARRGTRMLVLPSGRGISEAVAAAQDTPAARTRTRG
jgi:hypothetical protein